MMIRSSPLALTQLEAREVPSATMFADVRTGIWGSYPLNLTPSGGVLYFSADNGHGYELYRTSGDTGDTRMVKDIKPGVGGSDPANILAADNGVVYFTANDGNGRALWRTDAAGNTTKVPGIPAGAMLDRTTYEGVAAQIGRDGKLYFAAYGASVPSNGRYHELWVTDGTTTTRLANFGISYAGSREVLSFDGDKLVITRYDAGMTSVWISDGTKDGTRQQQVRLTGNDPSIPIGLTLSAGVEVRPGVFVHPTRATFNQQTTLWVSDGLNQSSVKLLATIPYQGMVDNAAQVLLKFGNKLYFSIQSTDSRYGGLWETDGTAAGTRHLDITPGVQLQVMNLRMFNDELLLTSYDNVAGRYRYYLSNGTAAGTHEIPLPEAPSGSNALVGEFPDMAGYPGGALIFKLGATGKLYITTGTVGGWADTSTLPSGFNPANVSYPTDSAGRAIQYTPQSGVVFDGAIYFQAASGEQRAELWKWNPFTAPTQTTPPIVVSTIVNDGVAQRSVVTSLTVSFDRAVNIEDGALQLTDAKGKTYLLYIEDPVQGQDSLHIHFGGLSLPDGRYTLTVRGGRVTDAATGAALANDYTFSFTRLYGDLNGDGVYDREARSMVHNSLGLRAGDAGYLATLDVNLDGVIDATDELAVVRNWGKSV